MNEVHRHVARGRGYASRLACALLLGPLAALASPMTAPDAKARADASEASLSSDQAQRLVEAQGALASTAFPTCASTSSSGPTNFTVVLELDRTGVVVNSWLIGETTFSRCFREAMVRSFVFQPPAVPFFTSFEYSNAPR
jgi:hypothetical protein